METSSQLINPFTFHPAHSHVGFMLNRFQKSQKTVWLAGGANKGTQAMPSRREQPARAPMSKKYHNLKSAPR